MNVVARLYTLGTFRELLHTELEYHRYLNPKTGRCGEVPMGGMLTLSFIAGHEDDRLQRWILHSPKGKFCTLTESKVVFYKGSFDGTVLFEYHFNDSALVMWHESFCTHGEKPMTITLKISSAIHKIKGVTHIKPWQESWVKPKEQQPYTSAENSNQQLIIESAHFEDEQGNTIDETYLGKAILLIKTSNRKDEKLNIDLSDYPHDFMYRGKLLENDILNNVVITGDITKVPLEIVETQKI